MITSLGRAGDDAPAGDVDDPVEVREQRVDVVRDEQDRDVLGAADPAEQRRDGRLVGQVEAVERLVEEEQLAGEATSACAISSRCCSPPEHSPIGRRA